MINLDKFTCLHKGLKTDIHAKKREIQVYGSPADNKMKPKIKQIALSVCAVAQYLCRFYALEQPLV